VNGIKTEYSNELHVVSVDIQSALGKELSLKYGSFTPTFVFFDVQGEEVWRMVGKIDKAKVSQSLQ
jgi:thioredoxin-related protein